MFGLSNLQIYRIQGESNGMKVTANILEKFIRNEVIAANAAAKGVNNSNVRDVSDHSNVNNNLTMTVKDLKNGYNSGNEIINNNNNNNIKIINNNDRNINNNNDTTTKDNQQVLDKNNHGNLTEQSSIEEDSSDVIIDDIINKRDLATPTNGELSLDMQRKKYMQLISFLNQTNQHLEEELIKEKRRRTEELSKIVKSLLCFEAKLKQDKKVINQKLYEKDNEICRLINLNKVLKQKNENPVDNNKDDPLGEEHDNIENDYQIEAQFCPNCRKEFYGIDGKDVCTQTFNDGRGLQSDNTEHSSSDETLSSSFCGARRSIRYTSKRTFGTFRDYMRSRCMNIEDPNYDNSEENRSTLSRDDSQSSGGYGQMQGFSRKIDRLHGIKNSRMYNDDTELLYSDNEIHKRSHEIEDEDDEDVEEDEDVMQSEHYNEDIFLTNRINNNKNNNNNCIRIKEFAETSQKHDFETSTDDWYASASDIDDTDSVRAKYGYNAVNPVLECVNQILLQQSMEESLHDGPTSLDSSENNSGSGSGSGSGGSSHKDNTTGSRKRVHFSTKNSMVHVPRDDSTSPTTVMDSNEHHHHNNHRDNCLNYESIYSNEYEPIGSEHNSSNHYVDMESKLGQEDCHIIVSEKPKHPPALPPKPANLMKFKRVLRIISPQPCLIKDDHELKQDDRTESEPDYCSISEVNESITSVQIVADVHKSAEDDDDDVKSTIIDNNQINIIDNSIDVDQSDIQSQKTDDIEEIFADVPKLPNVAAIIAPKVNNKFINHDNYIMKSPTKDDTMLIPQKMTNHHPHVPNILAEINKKINTIPSVPTTPTKGVLLPLSPNKLIGSSIPTTPVKPPTEDKLPLEAEFDWYNLDAEYGKSNQPDVIKETDPNNIDYEQNREEMSIIDEVIDDDDVDDDDDDLQHNNLGVEYNLDEEFCLINQPDIIKENVLEPKTVCDGFPTIVDDQTPCNQKIKVKTSFTNFIDNSGLSTKPLPRQRKIYFSGPFV